MPGFGTVGEFAVGQTGNWQYAQTISPVGIGAVVVDAGKAILVVISVAASGVVAVSISIGKIVSVAGAGLVTAVKAVSKIVGVPAVGTVTIVKNIATTLRMTALATVVVITLKVLNQRSLNRGYIIQ